ncbi:hypothetical protein BDQ94DRAFT_81468 [Aspergillus welwitschiae]|uniref:Secreted protein n=1 Tax=Aspergillus welwitschiae TaxID=1341132 RepID=A0A3F3PRK6_9EURO|nr:hypothetical protein BDQ94DRAFT_81468 [Aspergillus welwitschiae]RDH29580.1 hypothetical protein BDQ94DRAFT_81468 [Aspergillus welwitschiae]
MPRTHITMAGLLLPCSLAMGNCHGNLLAFSGLALLDCCPSWLTNGDPSQPRLFMMSLKRMSAIGKTNIIISQLPMSQ